VMLALTLSRSLFGKQPPPQWQLTRAARAHTSRIKCRVYQTTVDWRFATPFVPGIWMIATAMTDSCCVY